MSIGKYTHGSPNVYRANNDDDVELVIGNFCFISDNVNIYLGGSDRSKWVTAYPFGHIHTEKFNNFNWVYNSKRKGDVIIGNDVWIGANVVILSGVNIGDGSVILNNSHVVKDIEPYSIVGGNPAKKIKNRFTPEQIEKLLKIKWWYWDDEMINQYISLLCNENIEDFILAVL
jgi:acetyltransferase-like isoleucine patch superfamily enzyme